MDRSSAFVTKWQSLCLYTNSRSTLSRHNKQSDSLTQNDRYRAKIAQLQNERDRAEFRLKTVERRYQATIDNLAGENAVLERKIHVSRFTSFEKKENLIF